MGRRALAGAVTVLAFACPGVAGAQTLQPLDPQVVQDQYDMSWADYKAIPNTNYKDPAVQPTVKKWKVALVLGDFTNRDFYVTQAPGSTVFGNPQATAANIPRAEVARFYADFLNKPQPLNNEQSMNRYWMENSFGKYGVELVPYGPYRLDGLDYQYWAPASACPRRRRRRATRTSATTCARSGSRRSARTWPTPTTTSSGSPPARTRARPGRSSATASSSTRTRSRGVRAAGRGAAELGRDALRRLDLVGRARERVAERVGQQLDRGRELGHGHLRP